jgi:hypothetical protein
MSMGSIERQYNLSAFVIFWTKYTHSIFTVGPYLVRVVFFCEGDVAV